MQNSGLSDTAVVVAIFGTILTVLVTVAIFYLSGLKSDFQNAIGDLWKRINNHHHEVECSNDKCHVLKTGGVVIGVNEG